MSLISTKAIDYVFRGDDQTIVHKAGGNSLSSYAQAVILIEKSGPTAELVANRISCADQASNRLVSYRIKVTTGTLISTDVNIEISFEASETTVFETAPSGSVFEKSYSEQANKLLVAPKVHVKVTGRDSNNTFITYTKDLFLTFQTDCEVPPITCMSNSSQAIIEYSSLVPPFKVQLNNAANKQFDTLQELVAYLNANDIAVNFYKKVE